jgi:hypothetical protein
MSESGRPPGSGAESGPRRWLFWLVVPTLVVLVVLGLRRLQSMRAPYVPQPAQPSRAGEEREESGEREEAAKPAGPDADTGTERVTAAKSQGAESIELVEVPCHTGEPRQRQEEALAAAGLRVGFTLTRLVKGEGGQVVETQPAKGTKVPVGSRVDLVVSVAGENVGDVIGLSAGAARGRLVRAGFQVKRRRITAPEGVPIGTVVEQDPKPGTLAPLDSVVTLRVAAEAGRDKS